LALDPDCGRVCVTRGLHGEKARAGKTPDGCRQARRSPLIAFFRRKPAPDLIRGWTSGSPQKTRQNDKVMRAPIEETRNAHSRWTRRDQARSEFSLRWHFARKSRVSLCWKCSKGAPETHFAATDRASPPDRFSHPRVRRHSLGDLDRQGHVNNAVFATYSSPACVGLIYDDRERAAGCRARRTSTFFYADAFGWEIDYRSSRARAAPSSLRRVRTLVSRASAASRRKSISSPRPTRSRARHLQPVLAS